MGELPHVGADPAGDHASSGNREPFQPYLEDGEPPAVEQLGERRAEGIRREDLRFPLRSGPDDDQTVVYAARAAPDADDPDRRPAVLVLHGGTQTAQVAKAEGWARRGYVSLAPTLPGIASPEEATRSSGPWTETDYGADRFTADPTAVASSVFDATVAALRSFALLSADPAVDPDRIGIVGISWGGYVTTMLAGLLGSRVAAAISLFGAGYFDEGSTMADRLAELSDAERRRWLETLDAGRHVGGVRAPFFQVCATNDAHFFPPSVQRTLDAMPRQDRVNQVFAPNADHGADVPGGFRGFDADSWLEMSRHFFDYHLREEGDPFPVVEATGATLRADGALACRFRATGPVPFDRLGVCYGDAGVDWPDRTWQSADARRTANCVEAVVSASDLPTGADRVDWFATVTDDRPVTVTSRIRRLLLGEDEPT